MRKWLRVAPGQSGVSCGSTPGNIAGYTPVIWQHKSLPQVADWCLPLIHVVSEDPPKNCMPLMGGLVTVRHGISLALAAAIIFQAEAMDGMTSSNVTGQCVTQGSFNSMGESCVEARAWFYKAPVFSLANTPAAAVQAVATRAVSAIKQATKNLDGAWSYYSMDTGVLAESVTPTTSGKALLLERQGNREDAVRR